MNKREFLEGAIFFFPAAGALQALANKAEGKEMSAETAALQDRAQQWSLLYAGKLLFTMPRATVIRTFVFNHLIHHRAGNLPCRGSGVKLPLIVPQLPLFVFLAQDLAQLIAVVHREPAQCHGHLHHIFLIHHDPVCFGQHRLEQRVQGAIRLSVRPSDEVIGKKFGPDKGNSQYLYELFPYGPAKQACKVAGLPKPTGCI